jgi:hypothetical protein
MTHLQSMGPSYSRIVVTVALIRVLVGIYERPCRRSSGARARLPELLGKTDRD